MSKEQIRLGALCLIASEILMAMMAAMVKHLSDELPTEVVMFFRNLLGMIPLLALLMVPPRGIAKMATRRFGSHFIRAVAGLGSMYCYFYTLSQIPLAEAVMVKMTTPFFIPVVAFLWMGDRVRGPTVAAILLGFVGVAFILRPMPGHFDSAYLIALLGALLMSIAMVGIRNMAATEPATRIVFWFTLTGTVISAVPLLWTPLQIAPQLWPWLLAMGIIATFGQSLMTLSYRFASPARIGVYNYSSVIWAALLGYLFWDELLHWTTLVGTVLIIAAGVWNLRQGQPKPAT